VDQHHNPDGLLNDSTCRTSTHHSIFRIRAGNAALPLASAYDVFEQTGSPSMPLLFRRRFVTDAIRSGCRGTRSQGLG
jgi:hypothetical protein